MNLKYRISTKKIYLFLISILFIVLLDYIYQIYITQLYNSDIKSFGYYGYPKGSFNLIKFYFVFVILLPFSFLLPDKINTPSKLIIVFYYFFSILPFFALFILNLTDDRVFYIEFISIIIFFILTYPAHYFYNRVSCDNLILNNFHFYKKIILFLTFGIIFFIFMKFVIHTKVDSLLDVYSQRKIFNNAGFIVNYLVSFLSFGVISFLFFVYILEKKIIYLLLVFMIIFLIFLSTGSKLIFGSVFLIFLLILIYRNNIKTYKIGFFLLVLIIFSILIYSLLGKDILISLLIRRTFILPAQIFDLYFSYFSIHDFNLLSEYTKYFFDTSYIRSASHVIGSIFFLPDTHANSGIVSDAYANFGIVGVIIFSIILCFIFIFLNFLNSIFGNNLTPLFGGIAVSLTNSGLLGVFVYQIFPIIVVFFIFYLLSKGKLK